MSRVRFPPRSSELFACFSVVPLEGAYKHLLIGSFYQELRENLVVYRIYGYLRRRKNHVSHAHIHMKY